MLQTTYYQYKSVCKNDSYPGCLNTKAKTVPVYYFSVVIGLVCTYYRWSDLGRDTIDPWCAGYFSMIQMITHQYDCLSVMYGASSFCVPVCFNNWSCKGVCERERSECINFWNMSNPFPNLQLIDSGTLDIIIALSLHSSILSADLLSVRRLCTCPHVHVGFLPSPRTYQ